MTMLVLPPNLRHESVTLLEELAARIVRRDQWPRTPDAIPVGAPSWRSRFMYLIDDRVFSTHLLKSRIGSIDLAVLALSYAERLDRAVDRPALERAALKALDEERGK